MKISPSHALYKIIPNLTGASFCCDLKATSLQRSAQDCEKHVDEFNIFLHVGQHLQEFRDSEIITRFSRTQMIKKPCTASVMIRCFSNAVNTHLPTGVEVDQFELSYWKVGWKERMSGQDPGWPFKPVGPFFDAIP